LILVLLILCSICSGCVGTDELLSGSQKDFISELEAYELAHEGEIPKSVLDTLDFMLENYTDGIAKPKIDDIQEPDLTDDQIQDIIDNTPDKATNRDEVKAIILKALKETQPEVSVKMDKSLYSKELVYEVLYEEIGGTYIVESLGGVNYWWWNHIEIPGTNECTVVITFSYFKNDTYDHGFTLEQVKQMKIELQQKAEQIVKDLNLNSLSDYEKVVAVNKYLCDNIVYSAGNSPYKPMQHTPYGALINGDCVCEGYAKAAQLLFTLCGVESYYVIGDTPTGGHGWNIVKVNGNYYQLDVTWNDADGSPNQYFLVTDDYMSLSRTWDRSKYPKTANKPYSN